MKKFYKYTLLKQDGTEKELGIMPKQGLNVFYKILNCTTIEMIPPDYYDNKNCTLYGDEEARFNENNIRNPHFKVLKNEALFGDKEWDVVGDIIKEEVYKKRLKI